MNNRLEESIDVYRKSIARFPNNVVAFNGLAEALKQAGRYDEALDLQRETVARFPNDAVAFVSLADTLARMGKIEESIDIYRESVARFPNNVVAMTGLAEVLRMSSEAETTVIESSQPLEAETKTKPYRYQIALSFAGEDRSLAKEFAQALTEKGVSVFFDEFEQSALWGKDLYQHLQYVYRDSAHYCVILISKNYVKKLWTKHELKQAQARAFEENREYILPLRIDDTEVPGLSKTIGYLDIRNIPISVVVQHVIEKLGSN